MNRPRLSAVLERDLGTNAYRDCREATASNAITLDFRAPETSCVSLSLAQEVTLIGKAIARVLLDIHGRQD